MIALFKLGLDILMNLEQIKKYSWTPITRTLGNSNSPLNRSKTIPRWIEAKLICHGFASTICCHFNLYNLNPDISKPR